MSRTDWKVFDDQSRHLDRFGLLLFAALVAVVGLALVDLTPSDDDAVPVGALLVNGYVALLFVVSMSATGVARRWRRLLTIGLMASYLGTVILAFVTIDVATQEHFRPSALWAFLAILVPIAVVRRVVMQERVTIKTLLGAIVAYLLLAFSFFMFFLVIDAYQSAPFFGEETGSTEFMYFSLVTITTLGYGDLSPVTDLGRLAAVSEAVIGQVFLVTLVAALVSRFASQPRSERMAELRHDQQAADD